MNLPAKGKHWLLCLFSVLACKATIVVSVLNLSSRQFLCLFCGASECRCQCSTAKIFVNKLAVATFIVKIINRHHTFPESSELNLKF